MIIVWVWSKTILRIIYIYQRYLNTMSLNITNSLSYLCIVTTFFFFLTAIFFIKIFSFFKRTTIYYKTRGIPINRIPSCCNICSLITNEAICKRMNGGEGISHLWTNTAFPHILTQCRTCSTFQYLLM